MFPEGYFYILSRNNGFALDVYDGQTKEDANIIVWPQKFQDSENQLWSYEGGRLINKKSGHALDISSSAFRKDKTIVQKKRKPTKQSQEWVFDQGFICSKEFPNFVMDIKGGSTKGGAQVILYKRKDSENDNQLWTFEQSQQFEGALNMATSSVPLHKKEGFGQPRLGYAAEVGVPPELTALPENNNIAGVGKNTTPTATTTASGNSRVDPLLAQYGSFYGGSSTFQPPAQPGNVPSNNYPPPPPPKNADTYPPQAEPLPNPMANAYPPPTGYPPQDQPGYPPQDQSGYPSNYPPPSGGYPPAPQGSYPPQSNYPPQGGYPPPTSPGGYPPPPGFNGGFNSGNQGYPPQYPPHYPPQQGNNYPGDGGYGYPPP